MINRFNPNRMQFHENDKGGGFGAPLNTSIGIDFEEAQKDITTFNKYIDSLSTKFSGLSRSVEGLHLNVADLVEKELKSIKADKSQVNIKIADILKKKIEKAISSAVARDIEINDTSGTNVKFTAQFTENQINTINQKIASGFINSFKFNPTGMDIKISTKNINELKSKFSDFLSESFGKNRIRFITSEEIDVEGIKLKDKLRFEVEPEHWQALLDSVQTKFAEFIGKPDNIRIDIPQKLNLNEPLNDFFMRLENVSGSIIEEITKASHSLANFKVQSMEINLPIEKLEHKIRESLDKFISNSITSLKIKAIDETQLWDNLIKSKLASKDLMTAFKEQGASVTTLLSKSKRDYASALEKVKAFELPSVTMDDVNKKAKREATKEMKKLKERYEKMMAAFTQSSQGALDVSVFNTAFSDLRKEVQNIVDSFLKGSVEKIKSIPLGTLDAASASATITDTINSLDERIQKELGKLEKAEAVDIADITKTVKKAVKIIEDKLKREFTKIQSDVKKVSLDGFDTEYTETMMFIREQIKKYLNDAKQVAMTKDIPNVKGSVDTAFESIERYIKMLLEKMVKDVEDKSLEDKSAILNKLFSKIDTKVTEELNKAILAIESTKKGITVGSSYKKLLKSINNKLFDSLDAAQKTVESMRDLNVEPYLKRFVLGAEIAVKEMLERSEASIREYQMNDISESFKHLMNMFNSKINESLRMASDTTLETKLPDISSIINTLIIKLNEELAEIEQHINSESLDKASEDVSRIFVSLNNKIEELAFEAISKIESIESINIYTPVSNIFADMEDKIERECMEAKNKIIDIKLNNIETYFETLYNGIKQHIESEFNNVVTNIKEISFISVADDVKNSANLIKKYISESLSSLNIQVEQTLATETFSEVSDSLNNIINALKAKLENSVMNSITSLDSMEGIEIFTPVSNLLASLEDKIEVVCNNLRDTINTQIETELLSLQAKVSEYSLLPVMEVVQNSLDTVRNVVVREITDLNTEINSLRGSGEISLNNVYIEQIKKLEVILSEAIVKAVPTFTKKEGGAIETSEIKIAIRTWNAAMKNLMKEKVMEAMQSTLEHIAKAKTAVPKTEIVTKLESSLSRSLSNYTNEFFKTYLAQFGTALNGGQSKGWNFNIKTKDLHSDIKKKLAKQLDTTVAELEKAIPELEGASGLITTLREHFKLINDGFNDKAAGELKQLLDEYKEVINKVKLTNDTSAINVFTEMMDKLQQEIVRKVKRMIEEQFNVLMREVRGMKIIPGSIGDVGASLGSQLAVGKSSGKKSISILDEHTPPTVESPAYKAPSYKMSPVRNYNNFQNYQSGRIVNAPGGDTRTFSGAIVNTLRYIIAGQLIGQPLMRGINTSWESAKAFDEALEKSRQNILSKYRGLVDETGNEIKAFQDIAKENVKNRYLKTAELAKKDFLTEEERVFIKNFGVTEEQYNNVETRSKLIENTRNYMSNFLNSSVNPLLQNLGINYGIDQQDVATMWSTATRGMDDPRGAYYLTKAAARIHAMERAEISPEDAVEGMEAIKSQWGIEYQDFEKYSSMLMKTATLNQSTVKDLFETQEKSGAVFKSLMDRTKIATSINSDYANLSDSEKRQIEKQADELMFARSLALSSIFVQATARSGAEGGTFWRNAFAAPFEKRNSEYLASLANSMYYNKDGESLDLSYLNPYKATYDDEGRKITEIQNDGYEMFNNIIRGFMELRASGNDQQAYDLISSLYNKRNMGSQQAVTAIIEDLDREYERISETGEMELGKGLERLVENIAKGTAEQMDEYLYGMSQTMDFKEKRLRSTFQAASFEMIETLKPEFSRVMDSLTGMLKYLRDNADTVSTIVSGITKLLLAVGVRAMAVKGIDKAKAGVLGYEYESMLEPLTKDRVDLLRKRGELEDKYNIYSRNVEKYGINANSASKFFNKKDDVVADIERLERYKNRIKEDDLMYSEMLETAEPEEYNDIMDKLRENTQREKDIDKKIKIKKESLRRLNIIDKNKFSGKNEHAKNTLAKMRGVQEEINEIDKKLYKNSNTSGRLQNVFKEQGVSEDKMTKSVAKLTKKYQELYSMEKVLNLNAKDHTKAREKLDRMYDNNEISAKQYLQTLRQLNNAEKDLIDSADGKSKGKGIRNFLASKTDGMLSLNALKGIGTVVGGALKSAGVAALIAMAMDAVSAPIMRAGMTKGDAMQDRFNTTKGLINKLDNVNQAAIDRNHIRGIISGTGAVYDLLKNTLVGILEGDYEGLQDKWGAFIDMGNMTKSKDEVLQELSLREKEIARQLGEEQRAEEERLLKGYYDIDGYGRRDYNPEVAMGSIETVQENISRLIENLNLDQAKATTEYNIDRNKLKIQGLREDSDEARDIMEKFLNEVSEAIKHAINVVEQSQKAIVDQRFGGNAALAVNDPAWKEYENKRLELMDKFTSIESQKIDNDMTAVQEILESYGRRIQDVNTVGSMLVNQLLASGNRNESFSVLDANNQTNELLKRVANEELSRLKDELQNNNQLAPNIVDGKETNSRREEAIRQIDQLRADITGYDAQIAANRYARTSVIMSDMDRSNTLEGNRYRSISAQLERKGYDSESTAQKLLERQRIQSENTAIEQTISKLKAELNAGLKGDQATDVLIQISELEAKANENLTKIYKLFSKNTSFGVPSGLRIMTNYEYYTKGNTSRAFAVQQGNITVSFKVDNVYTTSKEDLEKNFAEPINRIIKKATDSSIAQLNETINRGIQNHV